MVVLMPHPLSMTELEFNYAFEHHIPLLAFVMRTDHREDEETRFIEEKIYKRGISCAHFDNALDFVNRLDNSLRQYLETYDGYSIDSLWSQITTLKNDIFNNIAHESLGFDLQMRPYTAEQDDIALDDILLCALSIRNYVTNLESENSAIYPYAYMNQYSSDEITLEDTKTLYDNIHNSSEIILQNWELIHLGLPNHATHIILSTMFLKLRRMQHRLLTEPWTEDLRKQVVNARKLYIETIHNSKYAD